jgi:hypothetical protein
LLPSVRVSSPKSAAWRPGPGAIASAWNTGQAVRQPPEQFDTAVLAAAPDAAGKSFE